MSIDSEPNLQTPILPQEDRALRATLESFFADIQAETNRIQRILKALDERITALEP